MIGSTYKICDKVNIQFFSYEKTGARSSDHEIIDELGEKEFLSGNAIDLDRGKILIPGFRRKGNATDSGNVFS
jgi:hypothetical protein